MLRSAAVPELRGGSFKSPDKRELMATLAEHLERPAGSASSLDRTFPLEEAAAALGYLVSGQAVGRVVITVDA